MPTSKPTVQNSAPAFGPSTYAVQPQLNPLTWDSLGEYVNSGVNSVLNNASNGAIGLNKSNNVTLGGFDTVDFSFMLIGIVLVIIGVILAVFQTKTAQEIVVQPIVSTVKTSAKAAVTGAVLA